MLCFQRCERRLSSQQNAQQHYRAVCRALATESSELSTFLDNIARGHEVQATQHSSLFTLKYYLTSSDCIFESKHILEEVRYRCADTFRCAHLLWATLNVCQYTNCSTISSRELSRCNK